MLRCAESNQKQNDFEPCDSPSLVGGARLILEPFAAYDPATHPFCYGRLSQAGELLRPFTRVSPDQLLGVPAAADWWLIRQVRYCRITLRHAASLRFRSGSAPKTFIRRRLDDTRIYDLSKSAGSRGVEPTGSFLASCRI